MTFQLASQQLLFQLNTIYEPGEAACIADLVMEKITGLNKMEMMANPKQELNDEQQKDVMQLTSALLQHKPVQYVLGEAWFMNMRLRVNEHVLIPRSETEELVDWIVNNTKDMDHPDVNILDIGTGSGCIAIALKKNLPLSAVTGTDLSEEALQVAKINAAEQNTLIDFLHADILHPSDWNQLSHYDIIVSNPPYISVSEKNTIHKNVLDFEPHLALFVPDNDPLLFYKAIIQFCKNHLIQQGLLYFEINEGSGDEVIKLLNKEGFINVELKKDMQGKDRMVKAKMGD